MYISCEKNKTLELLFSLILLLTRNLLFVLQFAVTRLWKYLLDNNIRTYLHEGSFQCSGVFCHSRPSIRLGS